MNTGFNIKANLDTLEFMYGDDVYGPISEKRKLDDIRKSLSDPNVEGPEYVYAVAMDVAKKLHKEQLIKQNLLYGAMIFCKGCVGEEPVRSQGHIHALSPSCGDSTCEVYEIWAGEAYIYMQESAKDNPGKCYAIHAVAGDIVIVPPNYAHATINANPKEEMLFGAWCVRDYGFDYEDVRAHHGVAYFPKVRNDKVVFEKNPAYQQEEIIIKEARDYPEFHIQKGIPIYT
ncbi:MAG: glucose-6-phosphate isomerase family protein, partial [Anaerorhabdus sp.]